MMIRKQIAKLKRRGIVTVEYLTVAGVVAAGVVAAGVGYFADDYTASMCRQSAELSAGIQSLNQGYSVPTQRNGCGAAKPGSVYVDQSAAVQFQTHACN